MTNIMFTSVQCLPTLLKLRFVLSPFVARLRLIIMVLDQSPPDQHPAKPPTPAEPPTPAVGGPLTKAPECSKSGVVNGPFGVGSPPLPTSSLPTGLFLPLTLSPQTCCELLMSDKLSHQQLLRDADLIRTHYPDFALTKGKKNDPLKQLSKLKEAFKAHFDTATYKLADSLLSQSSVTNHPPPELTQEIVKLQQITATLTSALATPAPVMPSAPSAPPPTAALPPTVPDISLKEPVSFHKHSINITVDELLAELNRLDIGLTKVGNRLCIHLGPAYGYGRVCHPPRDYPESEILKSIEKDMQKLFPDFSFDKYALLITLYPDGTSSIPPHPDNEPHIKLGSSIITANIGATRSLVLTNTVGPLQKQTHELSHGDVYVMSRDSQDQWLHSIPPHQTATSLESH